MKCKGSTGPDSIPPTFLKVLSPIIHQKLLQIFNASFMHGDCPRIWWVTTIILILKAGKLASEVISYQPMSLTSRVIKLLECILEDRLCYIVESKYLFSHFQAGFLQQRSFEDQLLQLFQVIEDGFPKNQCNVLHWLSWTSTKLRSLFGEKSSCYTCLIRVSWPPPFTGYIPSSMID